jgi:hypothetical protein
VGELRDLTLDPVEVCSPRACCRRGRATTRAWAVRALPARTIVAPGAFHGRDQIAPVAGVVLADAKTILAHGLRLGTLGLESEHGGPYVFAERAAREPLALAEHVEPAAGLDA